MIRLLFYFLILQLNAEPSLEEKIGQLLLVHFNGETVNEDARVLIQEVNVGGIIYYNWSNGLHNQAQVQDLSKGLQNLAKKPLFIAIDQEGGAVSRLSFISSIGNQKLGDTLNPNLAEEEAFQTGLILRSIGINMNFAPVVDISCNPKNPLVKKRSFGATPEIVSLFGERAINGYKKAGIIATLKHFPGHGDVAADSHTDLPILNKSIDALEKMELIPFKQLAKHAQVIMTAHLLVPSLDPHFCSTLSTKTLNYLREKIGYEGVIISDSLIMEGIVKQTSSLDEAAIQAIIAGCDILLLGGKQLNENTSFELNINDVKRIQQAIVRAVLNGRISKMRINEAYKKVQELKSLIITI